MTKNKKIASVMDRILLHLLDFKSYEGEIDGSMDLTQIGIADAIGIKRGNVNQDIQPLISKGYVECHKVHVPGIKIKRSNYYLTCQGYEKAKTVKEKLIKVNIEMIDREGIHSRTNIADLLNNTRLDIRFVDVVREANISRLFDCKTFLRKQTQPLLCSSSGLAGVPRPSHFFGRKTEGAIISEWIKNQIGATLVIQGMPGIGKTSFVSQILSDVGKPKAVHYFSIKTWCSLRALLMPLSVFLEDQGKRELRRYLEENRSIDISEVEYLILRTLSDDERVILAYDDYHNSSEEIQTFFKMLHNIIKETNSKLIVIGRTVNPFYDRKEVAIQKAVLELMLEGLDHESTLALAREIGVPDKYLEELSTHTHGHPLFAELLAAGGTPEINMDIEKFINDELITTLGDQELEVLKYMSVHRYAVEKTVLIAYQKVLTILVQKSILKQSVDDFFELHDLIKTTVYRNLSVNELELLHTKAAEYYLESYPIDNLMEALHHLIMAERYLDVCNVVLDKEERLLRSDKMMELAHVLGLLLSKNLQLDKLEKAHLLYIQGHALSFTGEWDDAIMNFNKAMVLASSDEKLRMMCKSGIGEISLRRNNYSVAKSLFKDVIDWAEKNDEMEMKAESSYYLGTVHERLGNNDLALDCFEKGMKISFKTHNRYHLAMAYYGQGRIFHRKQEYENAINNKNRALDLALKIGSKEVASKILTSIGNTLDRMNRLEDEIDAHERAITLARESGAIRILAYALSNAAAAYLDNTNLQKASVYLDEAANIFERLGERRMFATTELNKSINCLYSGKKDEAILHFSECEFILNQLEDKRELMITYLKFGQALKKIGCSNESQIQFRKALRISQEIEDNEAFEQIQLEMLS